MSKTFSMATMLEVFFLDLQPSSGGLMTYFFPAWVIKLPPGPRPHSPLGKPPLYPEESELGIAEPLFPFPLTRITTGACGLPRSMHGLWREI